MQLRNNTYSIIPVVALLIVTLLFGALQLYTVANLIILISCCLFYIINKEHIIFLFVVLLPTNGFFSTEHNIAGLFSPTTTSQLFALIVLFPEFRKGKISEMSRISGMFILSLFIFNIYYDFKNAYFNIYDLNYEIAFKHLIKYLFRFVSLYLLIKAIDKRYFVGLTINAIHVGVVLLILSSVFTTQLSDLGFLTTDASESLDSTAAIIRTSGFFAFGDVNSLGCMLACYTGFIIIIFYHVQNKLSLIVLFGVSVIGILYTGSRTAILSFIFILILFILIKSPNIRSLQKAGWLVVIIITLLIIYYVFQDNINLVFSRFGQSDSELDADHTGSRLHKWIIYMNYIWSNPGMWLLGSQEELWIHLGFGMWQARVPHNFYITVLFQCGGILLMFILYSWYSLVKVAYKAKTLFIIITPILAISFYVSDWGYFQYFILFLPILNYFFSNNKVSDKKGTLSYEQPDTFLLNSQR